jgi:hypothetical protein
LPLPLTSVKQNLPPEILAGVIKGAQISKDTSSLVSYNRCICCIILVNES